MKLLWKRIHPIGLVLAALFFVLATLVLVPAEREARRLERIIDEKKQNNPQEILKLRAKLEEEGIPEDERKHILWEIKYRQEKGWLWNSSGLPGNTRNPAIGVALALALVGIACLFYRPKKKNP